MNRSAKKSPFFCAYFPFSAFSEGTYRLAAAVEPGQHQCDDHHHTGDHAGKVTEHRHDDGGKACQKPCPCGKAVDLFAEDGVILQEREIQTDKEE